MTMSIFALNISPYITSSIIMQLLTIAIPALEEMQKDGEEGRKKINKITRYLTLALALIESGAMTIGFGRQGLIPDFNWMKGAIVIVTLSAGAVVLMWLGERITEKGIGNGVSMIIFASICSQVPRVVVGFISGVFMQNTYKWWILPVLLVFVVVIIAAVVMVDRAVRRIPVQYAKRVVGRKMYGGQSTHIPMKANANGVMPLIFAMTLMQVPGMIGQFWPDSSFYAFYTKWLSAGTPIYYVIYALLIVGFAYFYSTISFNPVEISKNLQQNGGFIPGIRPGKPTGEYLMKICNRLTLFGAFFLMCLAIIPTLLLQAFGLQSMFGPTSVLIMVSVALESSEQLESLMLMRHYKGFLG